MTQFYISTSFLVFSCDTNGVFSEIHPLDRILTTVFPIMFIVLWVKPQYKARIYLSTGKISNCGSLSLADVAHSVSGSLLD